MKRLKSLQFLGIVSCLAAAAFLVSCKPESAASNATPSLLDCAITSNESMRSGICAGKPITVALTSTEPLPFAANNFEKAHDNNTLLRVAKVSDKLGLFAIDLTNNAVHLISSGPFDEGIERADVSGNYVVWGTKGKVTIYNLRTTETFQIDTVVNNLPSISGDVIVWNGLHAYDLKNRKPFTIISKTGAADFPRISGDWVIFFDTNYDGPEWGHGAKLYAHNLKTNEELLIGEMAMGYGWPGFYAIDAPWVAWLSKPNLETDINDQSKLHLFNLDTRADRVVTPTAVITKTRSFPLNLQLDGNIVLYHLEKDLYGYDIARDVSFPIAKPSGAVGDPIISNDRLIWETPTDKEYGLTIENILRGQ